MTAKIGDVDSYDTTYCPVCGENDFFIAEKVSGETIFRFRGDGEAVDNSGMFDSITSTSTQSSKYCYCTECGERLFKVAK
ncbi:hypothetical protein [Lactiplantibacillus herbarum]|uniref:hypothetical protein n=1 Tax=Lactiplantibacillus herbarum TaxID=1670446 RepID=UPI00064FE40D|nr:hypothetical protein [Lactiplantibacillus herbarum]